MSPAVTVDPLNGNDGTDSVATSSRVAPEAWGAG